jgi:predicted RNA-binding Zn-ribbon protein involved in translation (DUF1610 family)
MKPHFHRHSCPQCGHYAGWRRIHFTARDAQWTCESCGSELCYGTKSKRLSILITFATYLLAALLFMRFHLVDWLGFALLMLAGIFPTVGVLRVVLAQSSKTPSSDSRQHAKGA